MADEVNIVKKRKVKKKVTEVPKKDLTNEAFGVIFNTNKNVFELVTLMYHPETKQAYVKSVEKLADTKYRALYELEMKIARGLVFNILR